MTRPAAAPETDNQCLLTEYLQRQCVEACRCVKSVNPCRERLPPAISQLPGPPCLWRGGKKHKCGNEHRHETLGETRKSL